MEFNQTVNIKTTIKSVMSDLFTPVGIYLRLRDKFRDTILLESAGNQNTDNNFSFIAINAVAGIEIRNFEEAETKFPLGNPQKIALKKEKLSELLNDFTKCFVCEEPSKEIGKSAQGFFGYTSYDAIPFFENIKFKELSEENKIPLLRYRLYQYVIAINHYNDEMFIIENKIDGLKSNTIEIENLINQKNAPIFPFKITDYETSNLKDEEYRELVETAKKHCFRGDVFQLVLSRRFEQKFNGDEFNVYRALRHINPSPYLFYFDYGDYKLMGSSPESQLIIKNGKAIIHPIAGTFKRTGEVQKDLDAAEELKKDAKEIAEHTMLVDLARNDLSICGKNTTVTKLKEVQFFSHVIHLVSEVTAEVSENQNPYEMIATTFPQGTLSGAPKYKAMELIDSYEKTSRSFYGGCIGFVGFDGSCNQAIMIRTFLSKNNTLYYQAGAGIVAKSTAENELQEVNNKLNALKMAVKKATSI
ncbi:MULTISPECIES: anthranilate synthase component I family protein [unclassified Kaistella]|uniref:anthranilate synthase component I family protein n=1 Tax=unclassified Kaistella TaxID=2762626 RepID=UPI00273432CD|nr:MULTISPECIES: anthranilate synthase component I family protein [unclassified Kaistella]MDP2454096.1 anthranilate synthase component I family protein [Kaistella sp. SH11-4b]MDP2457153.1 anthranilate synthase component I family protein [Kaistella sp. SH40-3]MDP2459911.1 anthranilate synthase component I family protein [Kaistella sp. SH19-2b]